MPMQNSARNAAISFKRKQQFKEINRHYRRLSAAFFRSFRQRGPSRKSGFFILKSDPAPAVQPPATGPIGPSERISVMCTGLSLKNGSSHYFGRNLDLEIDYPVSVVITPRHYEFKLRHLPALSEHYAMIGMGMVESGYPLYFESINEKGLGMAGLAFWTSCKYFPVEEGKTNVASFEMIPYILGQCSTTAQARELLKTINITDEGFSAQYAPSPLHWLISDENESIVVESTAAHGLQVYDNPYDVLTNEPEFPFHTNNLMFYCNVSNQIRNFDSTRFAPDFPGFIKFGAGMGSAGLPGGLDSISRFVRIAFGRLNSVCPDTEEKNISQFFHLLGSVSQTMGSDQVRKGDYEVTQYTCGANTKTLRFYYTTYFNPSLCAVDLLKEDLNAGSVQAIPVIRDLQVTVQN